MKCWLCLFQAEWVGTRYHVTIPDYNFLLKRTYYIPVESLPVIFPTSLTSKPWTVHLPWYSSPLWRLDCHGLVSTLHMGKPQNPSLCSFSFGPSIQEAKCRGNTTSLAIITQKSQLPCMILLPFWPYQALYWQECRSRLLLLLLLDESCLPRPLRKDGHQGSNHAGNPSNWTALATVAS